MRAAAKLAGLMLCLAASSPAGAGERGYGGSAALPYDGPAEAATAGSTIPLSSYSLTASKDGKTYSGKIVGANPMTSAPAATTLDILVVPLIVTIGGTTFDPTAPDSCIASGTSPLEALLQSPLFHKVRFDGGTAPSHAALVNGIDLGAATYIEAFRRADFWSAIADSRYKIAFKVRKGPAYRVNAAAVAALGGGKVLTTDCASLGVLPTDAFENYVRTTVLPAIDGASPTKFILFLVKDVVSTTNTALTCASFCTIGYHSATGSPVQTYGVASFDTTAKFWRQAGITDISVITHEIAEWLDDPLVTNPTPAYGNIGQISGCQTNWEVGDPLTGTDFPAITMSNGLTYHPQELTFRSWFYNADGDASLGAGGQFSMSGTFTGPSKPCPPGGTF